MSAVKGWCPGALRPMPSGDGLVVRVRPRGGRLTGTQARGIAEAARRHGNGLIDLTGRANLQLRGVTEAGHAGLIEDLSGLTLIDPDIATETRRNILVTPFADAEADRLAEALARALAGSDLALPAKFGFAVDCGAAPVLSRSPADIRIERDRDGLLVVRADGAAHGTPAATLAAAVEDTLRLAQWFQDRHGGHGRMAGLIASGARPTEASHAPAPAAAPPGPGPVAQGLLVALTFGQIESATLAALAERGPMRLTPWRMLLLEGAGDLAALPGLILDPGDPRLSLRACTGAPGCAEAHAATRALALSLAGALAPGRILHVSGCAKGCGWPRPADVTLTATPRGFDLIRGGCASDIPHLRGLSAAALSEVL